MKFVYGQQNMGNLRRAQENCILLSNGLGGFTSVSAAFSVSRNDQGLLVSARTAPNDRVNLVHRLSERLTVGQEHYWLSTQEFADSAREEDGYRLLSSLCVDGTPTWEYDVQGVHVTRQCAIAQGQNIAAVRYCLENRTQQVCSLTVTPYFQFSQKGNARQEIVRLHWQGSCVCADSMTAFVQTDGKCKAIDPVWETLYYADDEKDGRPAWGYAGACLEMTKMVKPGRKIHFSVVFSAEKTDMTAADMLKAQNKHLKAMEHSGNFQSSAARQLARAAQDYIAYRASTGGMTILAGYPFFGDWGRDTMIALPGCVLVRQDYAAAKSILRTFLAYEKDGLVPNLFPEGESQPQYNTVDAALLLLNCIWLYHQDTGDTALVQEAWPVMERIVASYRTGTHHGIHMDSDGLICAGKGMDQVTWMDVCVEGILPTPRHGKPVEINAYWYNALRIMEAFAPLCGAEGAPYGALAQQVQASFLAAFYMQDKGYLKDVISGTNADTQLRCNQIWAVTMPFTMLPPAVEKQIVDTVYEKLYTPCGLRTLSPDDPQYQGFYGGSQKARDMAYHQGTTWVFPLGAYYLAYLKVHGSSAQAKRTVRRQLTAIEASLAEGCIGHLPEIYDGDRPGASKGCFAQAWSVGEILRVYAALEKGSGHAG